MNNAPSKLSPQVATVIDRYPKVIRTRLMALRKLIFAVAADIPGAARLEETLKWGEPSYLLKGGSTIRINVSDLDKQQYAMYFHCQSRLVNTFKEVYGDTFRYAGNRAIIFNVNDTLPVTELKHCIYLALTYHQRKKLPLLGA